MKMQVVVEHSQKRQTDKEIYVQFSLTNARLYKLVV